VKIRSIDKHRMVVVGFRGPPPDEVREGFSSNPSCAEITAVDCAGVYFGAFVDVDGGEKMQKLVLF